MDNRDNLELLKGFAKGKEKIAKKGGRAVIYSRVSSKEQVEGFSLEVQMERCEEYAQRNGYVVVERFGAHTKVVRVIRNARSSTKCSSMSRRREIALMLSLYIVRASFSRTGSTTII